LAPEHLLQRGSQWALLSRFLEQTAVFLRTMPEIDQWHKMWSGLGAASDDALFHKLIGCYSERHRSYHTTRHLDECFEKLVEVRSQAEHPDEVELALWFHDAIYDVKRSDNEERSAEWARAEGLKAGLSAPVVDRVHALVMATRHDAVPADNDARILVDIDLSILGATPERFDEYELQVREEYGWVPKIIFRRKRRGILQDFLKRPAVFNTDYFLQTYEAQARANLERSILRLGG
jgi:predicted metal-dependent HD superfamily phosphohydrolase